jgi:hypothetical protein
VKMARATRGSSGLRACSLGSRCVVAITVEFASVASDPTPGDGAAFWATHCARLSDCCLRLDARLLIELVDHVPVSRERQARVVAELACDVDDAAALVQEEGREGVAERVALR